MMGSFTTSSSLTKMPKPSSRISSLRRSEKKIGKCTFIKKSAESFTSALTNGIDGSAKYIGVHVSQDMSWQTHVNKTAAKASSTLGFLRHNLHSCTQDVLERTYSMFVLPTLNYASVAWDPYLTGDVDQLEKVQRRGARYVKNNYHDRSPGCVTNMLRDLQWLPLKEQRRAHRLNYLHKIKKPGS